MSSPQHLAELLARIAEQDRDALRELYDHTHAKLFGICLRICGSRGAAEDVLQETYVKIWFRAGQYSAEKASPTTWLSVIARNGGIDWQRKNRTAPEGNRSDIGDVMDIIADEAPLADKVIENKERSARIIACLDELDNQQQDAIRSAFFGGNTYAVIAEQSDVPLNTMKSRIRRGLQKLRKCLEND